MRIFGCCRSRQNEADVVKDVRPSPASSQRFCKAVKLALKDTVIGAVTGGALGSAYGKYICVHEALCADAIFEQIQAKINNGTTSCNENDFISVCFTFLKDNITNPTSQTAAMVGVGGAVIGGSLGACNGIIRICRALLCQKTVKNN